MEYYPMSRNRTPDTKIKKTNTKKKENINLNLLEIEIAANEDDVQLDDNDMTKNNATVSVYFRDMENTLIRHIKDADVIIGCVAWLTNTKILKALKKVKHGVSIIVQKEDFLRPDCVKIGNLNKLYNDINGLKWHCAGREVDIDCKPDISRYSMCSLEDNFTAPIRCLGNHNKDKHPAFPRMHNKFIVFCKITNEKTIDDLKKVRPYAVWTGSFNLTHNSSNSLENAVYIEDHDIALKYTNEWAHLLCLSEPLDWESEWCAPQFRIGT